MDILISIFMSISFFSIIPMPFIEWTEKRTKYIPLWMPLVGLIIGLSAFYSVKLLSLFQLSVSLKSTLLTAFFLVITGGIHFDGLMDTADAYFSRRPIERKLEIMTDSRVGAFACMTAVLILLLKFGIFCHILSNNTINGLVFLVIPILSRTMQISMLYIFPKAKNEGLSDMFGKSIRKEIVVYFFGVFLAAAAILCFAAGLRYIAISVILLLFYIFYYFSSKKNFGGITGDILGAFIELSETLMFLAVCFI